MTTNLIEIVQQNLGIAAIRKVDPNTQDVRPDVLATEKHTVEQAALPAVLAGLYKYSTTAEGTDTILNGSADNWTGRIFSGNTSDIVDHVASYAGASADEAYQKMERIAKEAISVIRQNIKNSGDSTGLKDYLLKQRKDVLTYLPAELHAGDMLNDNTIDDRTNKMEGPVSSFMQKIGNLFTSSEGPAENTHTFK